MVFVSAPSFQQQNNKQTAAVQQSSKGKKPENHETVQSLWVPTDSVGLYTLVLAVFTGLLAVVAGVQALLCCEPTKRPVSQLMPLKNPPR
jgi:histidinol dehydrogenase